jgi:hypothetical protein
MGKKTDGDDIPAVKNARFAAKRISEKIGWHAVTSIEGNFNVARIAQFVKASIRSWKKFSLGQNLSIGSA